eukprot:Opistho-1_new@46059
MGRRPLSSCRGAPAGLISSDDCEGREMSKFLIATALAALTLALPAQAAGQARIPSGGASALLLPWGGPYGGVPPFDQVRVEDLGPALDTAMASQRREIRAISANPAPASFANTVLALERAQAQLGRVRVFYDLWTGSLKTPQVEALELAMGPKLAALGDELVQNKRLFARIEAVHQGAAQAGLTPEQQRLVW